MLTEVEVMEAKEKVSEILLKSIRPNRYQRRIRFDPVKMSELENSIREHGVAQPILIRPYQREEGEDQEIAFELVFGERRCRASKNVGCEKIPGIIRDLSDEEARELTAIENIQREDLTLIEQAESIADLLEQYNNNYERVSQRLGKSHTYVCDRITLLSLPSKVKNMLEENKINIAQAKVIAELESEQDQITAAIWAEQLQLTANELRGRVQRKAKKSSLAQGRDSRNGVTTTKQLGIELVKIFDALEGYDLEKLHDFGKRRSLQGQLATVRDKINEFLEVLGKDD